MPHDNTVQEAIREIAEERSVSLADARRILIERIDHTKRVKLSKGILRPIEISNDGVLTRGAMKKVFPENPHRRFHETDARPEPEPSQEPSPKATGTTAPREPVKSISPRNRGAILPDRRKEGNTPTVSREKRLKNPIPGSQTAIIVGELRDPEKDFIGAFVSLRGMSPRFDHLSDDQLRQRMREVAWRYEIPYR